MKERLERMRNGKGFIAALDQSGGSTPKALKLYGIDESEYSNDTEMFDLIHKMRTRIIKSPAFSDKEIVGAILFEQTMDRKIDDKYTADFLWEEKGVLPFLKVDKGLEELEDGVQLMKPIPGLDELLSRANERHIFGTKMRSVIKKASQTGIAKVVDQQFEVADKIIAAGLVPIIEPEVDIHNVDKAECETILKNEIKKHLDKLPETSNVMLKVTLPTVENFYEDLTKPSRNVTIFDGFSVVNRNNNPTIDISGFKTVPTGPVKAKIGFAALEGELGITGDRLDMRKKNGTFQSLSAPGRSESNFFNSRLIIQIASNISISHHRRECREVF